MKVRKVIHIVGQERVAMLLYECKLINVVHAQTVVVPSSGCLVSTKPERIGDKHVHIFIEIQPQHGHASP